jgi:cation diffusion facilitator family transporter
MSQGGNSSRAVLYALGANLAIAITKYAAAAITGSGSMLAEAVHSTADCGNQLLLLLGLKRSKREATIDSPLGFGKETYFWSFMVAIMLFTVGGMFSIYEGWHKLREPGELSYPLLALGVLGFGLVAESFSMWGALREVNKSRGTESLGSWFRTSHNSELVVIVGEDLAALLGLAVAFVAVLATWLAGNPLYDALGSVAIGVLLVVVAVVVAVQVKAMLIGQGVAPAVRAQMLGFLEGQAAIEEVLDLRTLHMGADVMVAVKAKMRPQGSLDALVDAINAIEAALKVRFPEVRWTFFEPDVR